MANHWSLIDRAVRENRTLSGRIRAVHGGVRNQAAFEAWLEDRKDQAYDWRIWAAASTMAGGCSDDAFSDFRSWLVLQGSTVFNRALRDPDTLVDVACDDPFTEELGTHVPAESPAGREWTPDQAAEHLPRLTAWRAAEDRRTRPTRPRFIDGDLTTYTTLRLENDLRAGLRDDLPQAKSILAELTARGEERSVQTSNLYRHCLHPGAFEWVAELGVGPDGPGGQKTWALFEQPSVDNLRKLIALGADLTKVDDLGRTALFSYEHQPDCIALLLSHGLDPEETDQTGILPYQAHRNPAIIAMLDVRPKASPPTRKGAVIRRKRK